MAFPFFLCSSESECGQSRGKTFSMSPPDASHHREAPILAQFFLLLFLGWTSVGRSNFFSLASATRPAESDRVSAVASEAEERGKKFFFLLLASSSSSSPFRRQENERISFLLLFLFVRNRCRLAPVLQKATKNLSTVVWRACLRRKLSLNSSCCPKIPTAWAYPVYFGACGTLNVQYKSIKVLQIFLATNRKAFFWRRVSLLRRISREMALCPEATQWSNFYFRLPLPSPSL